MGRQTHDDRSEDVVVITVWTSIEALYDWLGGRDLLGTPMIGQDGDDLFEDYDVQHYEAVDLGGEGAPGDREVSGRFS
jgi:heme-degrading monooxygenase HmoA